MLQWFWQGDGPYYDCSDITIGAAAGGAGAGATAATAASAAGATAEVEALEEPASAEVKVCDFLIHFESF